MEDKEIALGFKLFELFDKYEEELREYGAEDLATRDHERLLDHLFDKMSSEYEFDLSSIALDMIKEMREAHPEVGFTKKYNRWLGFIQGILCCLGMRSINQMRDESRPVFVKVEMASQDKVIDLSPWVDEVLEIIGHPNALVTDLSNVGDFFIFDDETYDEEMARISNELGFEVEGKDRIHDVARRYMEEADEE